MYADSLATPQSSFFFFFFLAYLWFLHFGTYQEGTGMNLLAVSVEKFEIWEMSSLMVLSYQLSSHRKHQLENVRVS